MAAGPIYPRCGGAVHHSAPFPYAWSHNTAVWVGIVLIILILMLRAAMKRGTEAR